MILKTYIPICREVPQGVPAHIRILVLQRTAPVPKKTPQYGQCTWRKQYLHLSLHHHRWKYQLHCTNGNSSSERHRVHLNHCGCRLTQVQTSVFNLEHRGRDRVTGFSVFSARHVNDLYF